MVSVGPHAISQGAVYSAKKNAWWLINTRHVLVNAACCLKGVYPEPALAGHRYSVVIPACLQERLSFIDFYSAGCPPPACKYTNRQTNHRQSENSKR